MKKTVSFILILALICCVFVGCGDTDNIDKKSNNSETSSNTSETVEVDFSKTDEDMFTDRDLNADYNQNDAIIVELNGSSAKASSESVRIEGGKITVTENKTHIISGTLDNGMIIVDAEETAKLQLVFNGVTINSKTSAALYILEADKVFVTLAENTANELSNGGEFTAIDENNIDATLFSKQDLTINGAGSLTVTSPSGHGIVAKDDLVITGGTYTVTSASHGIDANDSVRITGNTTLKIDAGKDGIHSENTDDASLGFVYISNGSMNIEAEGDGIAAGSYMQIEKSEIKVVAGGGSENGTKESSQFWGGFMGGGKPGGPRSSVEETETTDDGSTSMKGIKSSNSILITDGTITINSADDSIHSDVSVTINGGTFEIASGDDAIHAEETLTVTGGIINITESYEGLEALNVAVTGGDIKLIARDDGINAAGGTDSSGTTGGRDGMFGGRGEVGGGPGGMGGKGGMSASSNGSVVISGGNLYINSSGDGLDANGTLTISGGNTTVVGPTQGDTATLDYDKSGIITGGTFIGTGASNMAQSFSSSEQGVIALSVGNQSAGTTITVKDSKGSTVISHIPELSFQVVIISSPDMISGETYTVTIGTTEGEFKAN